MAYRLKQILSYFPLRYYGAAIFFALIFFSILDFIEGAQEYVILQMLNALNIPSSISNGNLFVGEAPEITKVILPVYIQLLFLIFFPTMALTARASFANRVKIILFGFLCLFIFIIVGFAAIVITMAFGILDSALLFKAIGVASTIVVGSLVIEVSLFSTIMIPERTKIKPLFKRRYTKEYAFLVLVLTASYVIVYGLVMLLHIDIDSPIMELVHLNLWLNMSAIVTFGYFLSNLIYEIEGSSLLRRMRAPGFEGSLAAVPTRMPSVSFLIPAYNEQRLAGHCMESIDKAAAKYPGKVEVVLINDGSTDDTEKVVAKAISNFKHASGRLFTISNSGKGFALAYGLTRTMNEIIFRTDADSMIDEDALTPMMNHFKDPKVGSVCGWVFPIQDKGLWIKVQNVLCANYMYTKRAQDLLDSIITQPGSSTAFRREALLIVGGWKDNIFGEDGEITNRISRYGYREIFEPRSIVYSEHPQTLIGLMQQRARWGVAFYHSRGRNLRLVGELRTPRSFIFLWNLASHGGGLIQGLIWPYLAALFIAGTINLSSITQDSSLMPLLVKLAAIQLSITVIQIVLYAYRLNKVRKLGDIKYFPFIRLVNIILNAVVKPQVIDIMLFWSSKWNRYTNESFRDLRTVVNRSVDPLYPGGEQLPPMPIISFNRSTQEQQAMTSSSSPQSTSTPI